MQICVLAANEGSVDGSSNDADRIHTYMPEDNALRANFAGSSEPQIFSQISQRQSMIITTRP